MTLGICPECGGVTEHAGQMCWACELDQAVELADDFDADELGIDPEGEEEWEP